jgi:hypothetical protein
MSYFGDIRSTEEKIRDHMVSAAKLKEQTAAERWHNARSNNEENPTPENKRAATKAKLDSLRASLVASVTSLTKAEQRLWSWIHGDPRIRLANPSFKECLQRRVDDAFIMLEVVKNLIADLEQKLKARLATEEERLAFEKEASLATIEEVTLAIEKEVSARLAAAEEARLAYEAELAVDSLRQLQ